MRDRETCPFCRIVRGDAPADVVCEADDWIAFFPDTPAVPGHTMVVPRSHVPDFLALDASLGSSLMVGLVRVGRAIEAALHPDGLNVVSSAGEAAEQSVFHLHFHVVPRRVGDRIGPIWPQDRPMDDETRRSLAALIQQACERA
jgi:histidine triad (HIT) family protein